MDIDLLDKPGNRLGFTAGHFALIAGFLAAIMVFSIVKGDLTWSMLANAVPIHAAPASHVMTYEEAVAQASKNSAGAANNDTQTLQQIEQDQLAQVDPSYDSGQVLGASTDPLPSQSIDQMFSDQKLNAIQLSVINNATSGQRQDYVNKLKFIESFYGTGTLLMAISSQDQDSLTKAETSYNNLINELSRIPVPAEFQQYHKLKLVYYSTLMTMCHSMLGGDQVSDMATAGTIFFGLNDKLGGLATDLNAKYGVNL